jgi:hypothetical protein
VAPESEPRTAPEPAFVQSPGVTLSGVPNAPVLTLPGGDRYGLSSEVAVLVFELCRRPMTPSALTERVVGLYEVGRERAEADIRAFLEALTGIGALQRDATDRGSRNQETTSEPG